MSKNDTNWINEYGKSTKIFEEKNTSFMPYFLHDDLSVYQNYSLEHVPR